MLAIDDDSGVHDLLRRFLAKYGFHVESAFSGEEGIQLARKLLPDAITLDVLMKGTDGWTVLRTLKGDRQLSGIPVIMLSVLDSRNQGFLLGATEYLSKPIDRARLLEILMRYRLAECRTAPRWSLRMTSTPGACSLDGANGRGLERRGG